MTTNFTSPKTFIATICGVVAICISVLGSVLLHQQQQYQSTHLASLAYLDAALHELTTFTSKRLVSDEKSFQRFRELNSSIVTQFQRLKYGNDSLGVSALTPNDDPSVATLLSDGEHLLTGFGKLIQSRQDINQYRQYNQRLLSEANGLVQATEAISSASEQQSLSSSQMKALGELTLLAKAQQYGIQLSLLSVETNAESLIRSSKTRQQHAQSLIQQLTASNTQLANPVLRRMIVNISDQLSQHLNTVLSLSNATNNYDVLEKNLKMLASTVKTLITSVNGASDSLSGGSYMAQLTVTLGAVAACLGFFFTGLWIKEERIVKNRATEAATNAKKQQPSLEYSNTNNTGKPNENTQQRKQIITEKNQLIHDIQPIVDGVFYVDANENAETTGEVAKAFNAARRSIVKRLQLVQQEVTRLQSFNHPKALEPTTNHQEKSASQRDKLRSIPPSSQPSVSAFFDIKSCVDITFETQTKIEQIKRLYSSENVSLTDAQTTAHTTSQTKQQISELMECQDHLRVRLRDLQILVDQHFISPASNNPDPQPATPTTVDLERLSRLVHSFQLTEVPRQRKMRKPTPQPTSSL
ncbi:hypothetical protein A9Q81_28335 [Gammaproteobacteria bacterium 42_54_T18]|nr:hypothetical protein A9Q81_28335 [Gammaproteobacteria bacterium 42_54_T18]